MLWMEERREIQAQTLECCGRRKGERSRHKRLIREHPVETTPGEEKLFLRRRTQWCRGLRALSCVIKTVCVLIALVVKQLHTFVRTQFALKIDESNLI